MRAPEPQGTTFSSFGRSLMNIRRGQVHSMEPPSHQELDLQAFQKRVADRFSDLLASDSGEFLSIPWIQKLLDVFLSCQDEFRSILLTNKGAFNKALAERYLGEYFERSVKGLDVCNAIRDGIEHVRQWQKHLEIMLCALDNHHHRSLGEGQFRRAKKALVDLAISMLDEKESHNTSISHRNRSFGRQRDNSNSSNNNKSLTHFRSLSWSVSRNWSAARQLQTIGNNLSAPRSSEIVASNGLALSVFTMSYVLYFVMWALVAAIPCQDRGLQTHFYVNKQQFVWAGPLMALHERVLEESKKKDRRNACGLLKEIHEIEKSVRRVNELINSVHFPLSEEKEGEARKIVDEVRAVFGALNDGLNPLECRVREVFHKIVRCRTEGLE
ncbi:unnamed protein product [Cuscuta campestris]|uniref:R3H domain-containing protein n=2 Tax=Cuscuta sect. Cleistogrammica TaxID=1824901 RepID=A0A484MF18_9ASTE|nr:hypothetical protein DM860_006757 [Cuscuta australis]VFQ86704.1 unnamed protein product [Cuscuta campestris]